jgi:hypothetical protein
MMNNWICIVHLIILGWKNLEDRMDGLFSKDIESGFYCTVTCIFLLPITSQILTTKLVLTAKYTHNSWTYSESFLILSGPTVDCASWISLQWEQRGCTIYFQFIYFFHSFIMHFVNPHKVTQPIEYRTCHNTSLLLPINR